MEITRVEPQKKNPKRFNIYLDGQFGFGADEDLVVKHRLLVGKEISDKDLEKLIFEAEVGKLLGKMYRWFGVRMRSEKETRDKLRIQNAELRMKGRERVSDLTIESLVANLKQEGFLDDERFAREWVESRRKKYGPVRIKQELYQKGIDREIIEQVMSYVVGEENNARKMLIKKAKRWKNLEKQEFRKKGIEFLIRKGFEYGVAKETVENFLNLEYDTT